MGEVKRVLKPGGSAFVNLGDKYATDNRGSGADTKRGAAKFAPAGPRGVTLGHGVQDKSLLGLPWAFALGCTGMLAALGGPDPGLDLILRAEIVWQKVNGLPESVRDRVRRSHEVILHFTKEPRYYAAVDEVREPHQTLTGTSGWAKQLQRGEQFGTPAHKLAGRSYSSATENPMGEDGAVHMGMHPLGKLPGSVWAIASEPLRLPDWLGVQHYAAFPSELPRRIILGWSPPGICLACGEGRWPVVDRHYSDPIPGNDRDGRRKAQGTARNMASGMRMEQSATILGYACGCCPFTDHPGTGEHHADGRYGDALARGEGYSNTALGLQGGLGGRPKVGPWREYHLDRWQPPPTRPAVVLDCFGGVGTSAMVARALGRNAFSLDLSHAYSRAADWRIHHSGQHGKAISRTNLERQGSLL